MMICLKEKKKETKYAIYNFYIYKEFCPILLFGLKIENAFKIAKNG
jgi:hypothetical protein